MTQVTQIWDAGVSDSEVATFFKSIAPVERIKRLRRCLEVIKGYGQFSEGQDGYRALIELKKFFDEIEGKLSPYGYCPHCLERVVARDRGMPDGNDKCANGHIYPSSASKK